MLCVVAVEGACAGVDRDEVLGFATPEMNIN